jgi:UDP-2,4-diacetamido-2,4,6-trideoxy-beta-L-altropyranose hydrolase
LNDVDVLIRADASFDIGTGHVFRCLVVADWLRRAGLSVAFAMREHAGNLIERVRARGYDVVVLNDAGALPNGTWLGVEPAIEVAAMQRLVARLTRPPRWFVVDHYDLDAEWEQVMAASGSRICALDDLANRPHDVDLLLDATLPEPWRYDGLVPKRTKRLMGLPYAPVRDDFGRERERDRTRDGSVMRVMVFYGGVDWTGETLKSLQALRAEPRIAAIDVCTGALNTRLDDVRAAIAGDPRACFRVGGAEMAQLTAAADLALGAISTAMWERWFVGCPSLVTSTLRLTQPLGPRIGATGAALWMGYAEDVSVEMLRDAIGGLLDDCERVREMSRKARALADGYVEARAEFVGEFLT